MLFQLTYKGIMKGILLSLSIILAISCSPVVQPTIDSPEIPLARIEAGNKIISNQTVAIGTIANARPKISLEDEKKGTITHPDNYANRSVESALIQALQARGVAHTVASQKTIQGEIRNWRSVVHATQSGSIESEATIYVSVINARGQREFEGVFQGSRSSSFPIVSKNDIKDSLAMAMKQALEQLLNDPAFQAVLR